MSIWKKIDFVIVGAGLLVVSIFFILSLLFPLPSPKPYSLLVEDRSGQLLHAFLSEDGYWRLRTKPEEIPEKLKRILIRKEDKYFYHHPGINPFSIARAIYQNIKSGKITSGASTITMQVARMMEPKERTYFNKMIEIFRTFQLEMKYSKEKILEMYLSMVPLGGNIEGLKSASLIYYQTPPERLNIAQLFDLILIPNDPNDLRPDRNPERLFEKRKHFAIPWIKTGYFTKHDSIIIWQTTSAANRKQLPYFAPHFCLRVKEKFKRQTEIRSSLDLKIQQNIEILLSNHLRSWKMKGVQNGAALIIDNRTKEIITYVGSENFNDAAAHGEIDAVKALRSPGSTLKPFLYAMQMDRGVLTPKTRLLDTPYDAEGFLAENYDGKYSGLVYADEALRRSLNVPMIHILRDIGTKEFVSFASGVGLNSLQSQKDKLGLSMILGGCGVSLEELTGAYSSFPSEGIYTTPGFIKQSNQKEKFNRKVFSPSAACMVTDILSGLDRPDLPNNFESSLNLPKVAFKTGTSYGRRDAWAIGYSAEYTVGVWIGNVTHKGNPELTGSKAAAPLLIDIFNSISTSNQKTILPMPSDLLTREVCATSGLLPTRFCNHIIEDYYSVRRTQNRFCEIDKEYLLSEDGKKAFCTSCLGGNSYKIISVEDYPAELLSFWSSIRKTYKTVPQHNPSCTRLFSGEGPKILSPSQDMTYYIFSASQKLALQAASNHDVTEQIWYIDERYFARNKPNERLFISVKNGEHLISCIDNKGRMSSVKIKIVYAM